MKYEPPKGSITSFATATTVSQSSDAAAKGGFNRRLLALSGAAQSDAAKTVVRGSLTARATEALVRKLLGGNKSKSTKKALDPNIRSLQDELAERLGARVRVEQSGKGGKLVIEYHSLDELDGILAKIR